MARRLWSAEGDPVAETFDQLAGEARSALWGVFDDVPGSAERYVTVMAKARRRYALIDIGDVHDEASSWALENAGKLVSNVSDQQKAAIARMVSNALRKGIDIEQMKRSLYRRVGLTPAMADRVEGYREGLIENGVPRGEARRRSQEFSRSIRKNRAAAIAETELQRALNEGELAVMRQMAEEGKFKRRLAKRMWITHQDERVCEVCGPMHGVTVSFDEPFVIGKTEVWYGPVHPRCRCSI
jgi:SPP1 gp7 family putative phage head morphogenesis protein